jgi:hypothetical protein
MGPCRQLRTCQSCRCPCRCGLRRRHRHRSSSAHDDACGSRVHPSGRRRAPPRWSTRDLALLGPIHRRKSPIFLGHLILPPVPSGVSTTAPALPPGRTSPSTATAVPRNRWKLLMVLGIQDGETSRNDFPVTERSCPFRCGREPAGRPRSGACPVQERDCTAGCREQVGTNFPVTRRRHGRVAAVTRCGGTAREQPSSFRRPGAGPGSREPRRGQDWPRDR